MTIGTWLTGTLQLLSTFVSGDLFLFIVLGMALLALYGVLTIIFNLIFIHMR